MYGLYTLNTDMATLIIYMRKYLPQVVSDEATEKYNLVRRLKEEELLLVKEMSSYISFYQRIISELEDAVRGIILRLHYSNNSLWCLI